MAGGLRGGWLLFLLAAPMLTAQEDGKAATLYCKCTWMDNWWFHLVEDLPRILGSAEDGKSMLARDETSNASRASSPSWKLLEKLVQKERLCRREPSLLELLTVETLCVPGTLATDLLCSLYYSFAFPTSEQLLRQSARRARRMRLLLYKAKDCLDATPWPFDVEDLEEYARSWLEFEAEVWPPLRPPRTAGAPPPPRWAGRSRPKPRSLLPADLRRCIPLQRGFAASHSSVVAHCWDRRARSTETSCKACCDPRFPRGRRECFGGVWTFETCCAPDDLTKGWGPPPQAVETLASPRTHPGIWRQLQELREELRAVRAANARAFESPRDSMPDTQSKATWDEVRQWVEEQLALPESAGGRQKIFPGLDLLLSTRACVGKQIELPWFLLGGRPEDAGVELASRSGALCSSGLLVAGELVSRPGRRATVPTMPGTDGSRSSSNSHRVSGLHKLESYGLELMAPCRVRNLSLDGSCFCGNDPCTPWTQFGRECCREDDGLQWHGVGLLTGELRTNIAHFARDALWLHRLFQGPESLEALGSGQRTVERVLTKHAATECMENDRCVKTGRQVIFPMEEFMEEA
ncbi:smd2 [Symbiodinium natans]|uniref:Smd2 protein n=1 Tax=Symbiodinium natans TaxID=878477 RepID=A0A812RTL5_9DINO|nr:smd2 [Symbiodinium natans]